MGIKMKIFFLLFSFVLVTKADFVDTLTKCDKNDSKCLQAQMQRFLNEITANGVPKYNIKPADPYDISNFKVNLSDDFTADLNHGSLHGLKKSVIKNYEVDYAKGLMTIELTCDPLQIDTTLTFSGTDETLQKLLAVDSLAGDGHVVIDIENFYLKFSLPFELVKGENGHIYQKMLPHKNDFKYDIGKVNFSVNNFVLGGKDTSQLMTGVLNSSWKLFVGSFDNGIFDTVLENFANITQKLKENIPVDNLTTEDLTPYLKN